MGILKGKYNCWRLSHADQVAFLVDGAAYFEALSDAIDQAQETILIAAWDIDSRIQLLRRNDSANNQKDLGEFLNAKAKSTAGLHVYVLNWDFPMLYAREREWLPIFNLGWKTHRRIHYHLDDEHPIGASQHQKFAVVDDRVAFCGGLDLSNSRWDTPEHLFDDPRRKNPDGNSYSPFHDIQMAVRGEAAATLGELFRDRWEQATGNRINLNKSESVSPWPKNLHPDISDIEVAISRTLPAYKGREEVREVEQLYLDGIGAAEKSIYIENQYLTSAKVAQALGNSLSQEEGPEIFMILPRESSGWLEQSTMDALRARLLKSLFKADRHHRLRVFYPVLDDRETSLYVHSKLMIVDDQLAVIGSANLSNRSMGLDSECNLAIEAGDNSTAAEAIASLRNRLLAEHLDVSIDAVSKALVDQPSMIKTIDSLSASSGRRLKNLDYDQPLPVDGGAIMQNQQLLDPEAPIEYDRMMDRFVEDEKSQPRAGQLIKIAGVLLVLLALAAAWRWTPLSGWINRENLVAWTNEIRGHPMSFPAVLGAYVVGGLIMAPVTLLVGVTAMIYAPVWGAFYAWSGCLLSALTTFLVGSKVGKQMVRKLAGKRLNRLSRQMAKQGVLTVAIIRNIPVAPFTIVNLIAGASHIRLKDYLIGTALGMLPGILAVTLFADRLLHTIKNPGWINGSIAAVIAIALIVGNLWLTKRLSGVKRKDEGRG
ncbi:MAG: VTT domain-containing protein [Deltaproteobacteria bacterium]|nr:VTT domain-containing protein [Deltaproteobacteria bacterium]